jgi:3-phenylpropionate/trans-cinnamate dioxygenase ferredoxin reductase component
MSHQTFVIVGGSLGGAKAAETLRDEGFDGRVVLIGEEDERPYERPPLSKEYLRGEAEGKPYVHDESFYAERDIDLRTGTVVEAIDPGASQISLQGGETLKFDRLLLTVGARARRLSLPGSDLEGVLYLRSVEDSDAIRKRIDRGGRLVTIGAGWIGAEVAASAKQRGCEVTIVEMTEVPLQRVLGPQLGAIYRDIHVDHGVQFIGGASVEAIEGDGKVAGVRLAGDRTIEADFVVVGVGVEPRVELAQAGGLATDNGIVCDEHLRTSAENVYAAGDVANAQHPLLGRRIRVEHWANALNQAPAAARNMLGRDEAYERVPYFFSDQYEVGMEYSGYATEWDEVVFRGDPQTREFIAFWCKDKRVLAGMNVNVWDVTADIQALIRSGESVDRARLGDPDTPLSELVASPAETTADE